VKKTLLSWSTGKDCAWALHVLRQDPEVELVGLLSSVNRKFDRVSMHSTRSDLLRLQAEALDLPLRTIQLPDPCSNEQYERIMARFVDEARDDGIECMAFGDLFVEDIRHYRERQLEGTGLAPLFPLWGTPSDELAEQMLEAGMEAYVSSVDLAVLPARVAGRRWSRELIDEFPKGVDPCGENGEIHTIVVGGPMFSRAIPVTVGETVERNGFAYADIVPVDGEPE